jgi:hypothetical protein
MLLLTVGADRLDVSEAGVPLRAEEALSEQVRPIVETAKELLARRRDRIRLDDRVRVAIERFLERVNTETCPLDSHPIDAGTVQARLDFYGGEIAELAVLVAMIARWGSEEHMPTLARVFTQIGDAADEPGGINYWLALSWVPFLVLQYCAGIAAVSAERYDVLRAIYEAPVGRRSRSGDPVRAVARAVTRMTSEGRDGPFKLLSAYHDKRTPVSEYLLAFIQQLLDGVVPIGAEFEAIFDRFEVLDVLSYFLTVSGSDHSWSPPGRFAWKSTSYDGGPFGSIEREAAASGADWAPVTAGLFGSSTERFLEAAKKYRTDYLGRQRW